MIARPGNALPRRLDQFMHGITTGRWFVPYRDRPLILIMPN
jgi:hypothetical protein